MSIQTKISRVVGGALLTVLAGCAVDGSGAPQGGSEEGALEPVTQTFKANQETSGDTTKSCTVRADAWKTGGLANFVTIGTGPFASWTACPDWCPANSFVYTVALRSEAGLGSSGDDTALNAITLGCFDRSTGAYMGDITSTQGGFGTWLAGSTVLPFNVNNPVIGGNMKIEGNQGSGDDTAANAVQLEAKNSSLVTPNASTAFGNWGTLQACPAGFAVCGVETKVEGNQGSGDDTSLNGIAFTCCSF